MAVKQVDVEGIGPVSLYKRRGSKNIRISITHSGGVRVTLPAWAPYSAGVDFVTKHTDWILSQRPSERLIPQGFSIGKAHHIHFERSTGKTVSSRLTSNQVRILLPDGIRWDSPEAQAAIQPAAIKALKKEAKALLPHRTTQLAEQHGYSYTSVDIKRLKGRWGSCSDKQELVFNCFLMQLPWELIDYVILHELAHTKVMAHGPAFWNEMQRCLPNVQALRKVMKTHKPAL